MIQKIKKRESWFFEGIQKINKPPDKLTKGPRGIIQINNVRNEKGVMTTEMGKFKKSSEATTKAYTQQNLKMWIKWTIFQTDTTFQN